RRRRDLSWPLPRHEPPVLDARAGAAPQPRAHCLPHQRPFRSDRDAGHKIAGAAAMTWNWAYAASIMPELMFGMLVTVLVTITCSAIALLGGLLIAVAQMSSGRAGHYAMRAVMEIFRGVPILVLLYFGFYALPEIGILLPGFVVGVLVLGSVYAAYCSEVY